MRARAEALGGTLTMTSTPGHGTTVVAVLPVTRAGEGR
jgi:signal transduction histidine kinase